MLTDLEKQRFEELKKVGFPNLKGDQRSEYKALKDKDEAVGEKPKEEAPKPKVTTPTTSEGKDSETIEIPKKQLNGILARLDQLEAEKRAGRNLPTEGDWKVVDKSKEPYTATLRRDKENYFLRFVVNDDYPKRVLSAKKNAWEDVCMTEWIDPDGKTVQKEVKLLEYMKFPIEQITLLKRKATPIEKIVGKTRRAKVDYSNYRTTYGGEVDMKVTAERVLWDVELLDKRKIELEDAALNT